MIRTCASSDALRLADIYNHYVRETIVTFEEEPVSAIEMKARIKSCSAVLPWLVWEQDGEIAGFAYATPWKTRSAYRFAVESTVYLDPAYLGRGIGTSVYQALIADLRQREVHCVVGGISLPNPASVKFHEKLGFTKVAHFKEVGFKFGNWIDVGYWEMVL